MKIKKRSFFELFLPLVIVGFSGQGSALVSRVISGNTRWLLFVILFIYLLANGKLLQGFTNELLAIFLTYLSWCALTMIWSEVFFLSFAKASLLILISMAMAAAGFEWVRRFQWQNSMNYLFLFAVIVLLTGILGKGLSPAVSKLHEISANYSGLTNQPNMFGMFQAMIFPCVLWELYKNWDHRKKRIILGWLLGLCLLFLIVSSSRSAMLMVICSSFFFFLSFNLKKKFLILGTVSTLAAVILSMTSFLIIDRLIHKNQHDDILSSRTKVWAVSYDQAILGGWMGGGYGVTIGQDEFVLDNMNAANYGREKSNSQLGIIEETGIIGFGLYLTFLFVYFSNTIRFWRSLKPSNSQKVLMGIVLGTMLGMVAVSVFEAWWDAPASNESVYFWTLFGVSLGLMRTIKRTAPYDGYAGLEAPHRQISSS